MYSCNPCLIGIPIQTCHLCYCFSWHWHPGHGHLTRTLEFYNHGVILLSNISFSAGKFLTGTFTLIHRGVISFYKFTITIPISIFFAILDIHYFICRFLADKLLKTNFEDEIM